MAVIKSPADYKKEFNRFKRKKKESREKKESHKKKTPEKKQSHKAPRYVPPEEREYVHFTVEVRPIMIERIIWLLIIAALVFLIFFNPIRDYVHFKEAYIQGNISDQILETNVVQEGEAAAAAQTTQNITETKKPKEQETQELTQSVAAEPKETTQTTPSESTPTDTGNEDTIVKSGEVSPEDITLTIEKLVFEDKGSYAKVTGVNINVVNSGSGRLYPHFSAYVYDDTTKAYDQNKIRGTASFDIGITGTQELEIHLDMPATFNNPSESITTKVVINDSNTGEILASETKDFTIDY